jgi:2-methylisocitrate lyase-like PEP mutase family enzyme
MANMVEGGRTPIADRKTLEEIGYSIAIFPAFGFLAAGDALRKVYRHLREQRLERRRQCSALQVQRVQRTDGLRRGGKFDETYRR